MTKDLNQLELLKQMIQDEFPLAAFEVEEPYYKTGTYWLDIRHEGCIVAVQWQSEKGYGVSCIVEDTPYDDGPDKICNDINDAFNSVIALLFDNKQYFK